MKYMRMENIHMKRRERKEMGRRGKTKDEIMD